MNVQPPAPLSSHANKIPASVWISGLLALGVVVFYWPLFDYGFIDYDDPQYVYENPHVTSGLDWHGVAWAFTTFHASNWHPLTWFSLMLDAQLFGVHPGVYHAVNVLFHAANSVLLFWLLKSLTGSLWRSGFVAALFAFHPLHVQSVAWIAERKDVLSTFFFLLTLIAYTSYAQHKKFLNSQLAALNYVLALLFFTLGLMSKPMLVTLPFVLLLLDFWPLQRLVFKTKGPSWAPAVSPPARFLFLLLEKVPFLALAAASCAVTVLAQTRGHALIPANHIPLGWRLQNVMVSYVLYLKAMVWPSPLAAFYPYPALDVASALGAACIIILITAVVFILVRQPYLAMGWLWYLGMLVPVIGLVQVGMQGMADRYTYVPLIGIFVAVTWGVTDILSGWRNRQVALATAATVVLGICLTVAASQLRYWRDSETLARHALSVTTNNAPMEMLLGNALLAREKFEEASRHFAAADRIYPDQGLIQNDLALALANQGKTNEAIAHYRIAIKLEPHEVKLHYALANLLSQQGRFDEAVAEYQSALQLDPNYVRALNDLAWLLATVPEARLRNGAQAVDLAEKSCRLTNYKLPVLIGTLAAAYAEAGRFGDATNTAEQAIALATAEGRESLAAKNRSLLELYRTKKAYHEPTVR
jgi:tetratricopeptide (TPR) repeat protein